MGKVSVVGSFRCREGKAEDMEGALSDMVEAAREEPGVEVYSYHRSGDDFWFFALMSDAEAMEGHGRTEAMRSAMEAFGPLVAEPPRMTTTTPVAALGLDL